MFQGRYAVTGGQKFNLGRHGCATQPTVGPVSVTEKNLPTLRHEI